MKNIGVGSVGISTRPSNSSTERNVQKQGRNTTKRTINDAISAFTHSWKEISTAMMTTPTSTSHRATGTPSTSESSNSEESDAKRRKERLETAFRIMQNKDNYEEDMVGEARAIIRESLMR